MLRGHRPMGYTGKQIGILTFHDGINHGGFWQAYATLRYIQSKGYEVEIINYKNRRHHLNELRYFFLQTNIARIVENLKKALKFRRAVSELDLSRRTWSVRNVGSYGTVVVGADIVWNFDWPFLGKDSIYFGHGLCCANLVAFSPSVGGASLQSVPDYVKTGLEKFNHVSVRDLRTKELYESVTGKSASLTLDPTFLIESYPHEEPTIKTPYLLIYAFELSETRVREIVAFARSKSLLIVALGYRHDFADVNHVSVSPKEWLGWIISADFVVSGTFHGTIFCIKNRKQFVTINNKAIDNKVRSLLSPLGLVSKLVDVNQELASVVSGNIDYQLVEERLRPLVSSTKQYLDMSLTESKAQVSV